MAATAGFRAAPAGAGLLPRVRGSGPGIDRGPPDRGGHVPRPGRRAAIFLPPNGWHCARDRGISPQKRARSGFTSDMRPDLSHPKEWPTRTRRPGPPEGPGHPKAQAAPAPSRAPHAVSGPGTDRPPVLGAASGSGTERTARPYRGGPRSGTRRPLTRPPGGPPPPPHRGTPPAPGRCEADRCESGLFEAGAVAGPPRCQARVVAGPARCQARAVAGPPRSRREPLWGWSVAAPGGCGGRVVAVPVRPGAGPSRGRSGPEVRPSPARDPAVLPDAAAAPRVQGPRPCRLG